MSSYIFITIANGVKKILYDNVYYAFSVLKKFIELQPGIMNSFMEIPRISFFAIWDGLEYL
mgnify:CR=1 FL=1